MSEEKPLKVDFYGLVDTITKTISKLNTYSEGDDIARIINQYRKIDKYDTKSTIEIKKDMLKTELTILENQFSKCNIPASEFIEKYANKKHSFTRTKSPIKSVGIDSLIVMNIGSDLYFNGKYGKVQNIYYNLDTDIKSIDTDVVVETKEDNIDYSSLIQDVFKWQKIAHPFYQNWINAYKTELYNFDNELTYYNDNPLNEKSNSFADVDIQEDKITIKKKKHFWN
jgi:hypothetical protein